MDWIYGLSRCWSLSPTCGIDWEAWSAILTGAVGLLAWRTSLEAKETAKRATEIAAAQHDEVQSQRDGTARIIAHLLVAELTGLPIKIEGGLLAVRGARLSFEEDPRRGMPYPFRVAEIAFDIAPRVERIQLPGAELAEPRLHTLPPGLGNKLSLLMSLVRELHVAANVITKPIVRHEGRCYYLERSAPETFEALEVMLLKVYADAVGCAHALQAYVGMTIHEYPPMEPVPALHS
ncbi:hypothetical protein OCJ37_14535 [Xanthomonas sp. AM6]|uniref:hypothetical protein n=1 Tax=Xanthomonas sp. AM6 TaxID=2982531 RepID=UPI0021D81ECE|nr:hypothetical protein [Xanthomonas sp. AM6]UYB51203.1 hypothetical protein OCJ37_14535 [Xanthomonas sp. AM6]